MMSRLMNPLFVLIVFFVVSAASATAAPVVVCGAEITGPSAAYSWSDFSEGRGKAHIERGDANGMFAELGQLLDEHSIYWPEEVKSPVSKATTGLQSGVVVFSDFKITKDVSGLRARQFIFQNTAEALEIPPNADDDKCHPESQKKALVAATQFTMLVERSGVEIMSDAFRQTAEVTHMLEGVYDKYLYEGFPMYPWEALANSWWLTDKSIANGPPRDQMIFFHLGAGVVGSFGSGSDTDIGAVLSLEPIGWVHYGKDYDNWYGVSLLTVFPFDRNVGVGLGFIYNNFKLGVTWHNYDNSDHNDPTVFLGVELYQFVNKNYRKYKPYKNKLEGLLLEQQ